MKTKKYKCTNGNIAYLSAMTNRVFNSYKIAYEDAKAYYTYLRHKSDEEAEQLAHYDVFLVHMWLDKE